MIGERLQYLRSERKITQLELAKALSVSKSSIAAYEQGSRIPTAEFIIKVAEYFDVSSDFILGLIQKPLKLSAIQEKEKSYIPLPDFITSNQVALKEFDTLKDFIIFKYKK